MFVSFCCLGFTLPRGSPRHQRLNVCSVVPVLHCLAAVPSSDIECLFCCSGITSPRGLCRHQTLNVCSVVQVLHRLAARPVIKD